MAINIEYLRKDNEDLKRRLEISEHDNIINRLVIKDLHSRIYELELKLKKRIEIQQDEWKRI